ncbi:MAG: hypothetical protein ACRDHP_00315 [Ktedonobacterales bacterium]
MVTTRRKGKERVAEPEPAANMVPVSGPIPVRRGALLVITAVLPALVMLAAGRLSGIEFVWLAAGYLLALPVLLAGLLLPPALPPLLAALGVALMGSATLLAGASEWIAQPVPALLALAPPSLFQLLCGVLASASARRLRALRMSVAEAERNAEIALAEALRARNDASQRLQLEEGLRPLAHALADIAEGKGSVRIPPARPGEALILGALRAAMDALARRMETLRRAEELLLREREATTRLAELLRAAARDARRPEWPEPANIPLDAVVAALLEGGFSCERPRHGSRTPERGDDPRDASGPLPLTRAGSGALPPGSGALPQRPGSGALPPHSGADPLFERLHSGPLPPSSGTLPRPNTEPLLARLYSGPLPPRPTSSTLPPPPPPPQNATWRPQPPEERSIADVASDDAAQLSEAGASGSVNQNVAPAP